MNTENLLPFGNQALDFPHFPTRFQTLIWRNWTLVPLERLARVLETTDKNVLELAEGMGLSTPPVVNPQWIQRGYITIIRNNWHLLPYEQLLQLLDWEVDRLAYTLKEDDFLDVKLGRFKPVVEPVCYRLLTPGEIQKTAELKAIVQRYFPDIADEDSMLPFGFLKDFETVPDGLKKADPKGPLRLVYSYSAVYGDPLLEPELDPYPEGLLARLADKGVNGVWLQGVLYTLVPFLFEPRLSKGWETRIRNLRGLCQKAANYGVNVYLYLNEPRGMTLDFYDRHPEIKGAPRKTGGNVASMCSSTPEVQRYLREGTERLFREVPELGGVFTITRSENLTNCWSGGNGEACPRCAERPPEEVIAEVNRIIAEGVHAAKPEARVIAWTWAWPEEWDEKAIDLLPDDVEVMCVSERLVPTNAMGIKGVVTDYSVSKVGPGPAATRQWKRAKSRGLTAIAKVQLNNSWECSAVPYVPSPDLAERHLQNLCALGVRDLMAAWTLGGWPGGNLELLDRSKEELALEKFGEGAAPLILKAWAAISAAFPNFPQNFTSQLYTAPQNYGSMCLFFDQPTGYKATMIGYPYDDLDTWRGNYFPEDVFEEQFRKLAEGWKDGLELIHQAETLVPTEKQAEYMDLKNVTATCYCHFQSVLNQIVFVRNRAGETPEQRREARAAIDDERERVLELYQIVREDSRIGFEASNHYYYTLNDLREKILNLERLSASLWNESP